MGVGIIVPVVLVAVVVPIVFVWARSTLRDGGAVHDDQAAGASGGRLTSNALRALPSPPWRVVYEIAPDKLGGVEHVLVGPAGVFAVRTSMDPLPAPPTTAPDARRVAEAAVVRGALDDALVRCAMASDRLVVVHWGAPDGGGPTSVEVLPGVTAVDGRRVDTWVADLAAELTPAQVDLAWRTVVTAIGRPDPLA